MPRDNLQRLGEILNPNPKAKAAPQRDATFSTITSMTAKDLRAGGRYLGKKREMTYLAT